MMMMMVDGEDFTCERTLVRLFTSMNLNTDTVYAVSSGFFLSLSPSVRSFVLCGFCSMGIDGGVGVHTSSRTSERKRTVDHACAVA